jgi:hypothetical protein
MAEAKSTKRTRDQLSRRLMSFCRERGLQPDETAAMLFSLQFGHKASTKLVYLSSLLSRLRPKALLDRFRSGLRRIAANEPLSQAPPISWAQLQQAMNQLSPLMRAALHLCWRTASRIDELSRLRRSSILSLNPEYSVIVWATGTKTSAEAPHQPHLYTELPLPLQPDRQPLWRQTVATLQTLRSQDLVCPHPQELLDALKRVDISLTGHSIKAGAITELMARAGEGLFPTTLVSMVAKHSNPSTEALARTTIRYARDPVVVARALQTRLATQYL